MSSANILWSIWLFVPRRSQCFTQSRESNPAPCQIPRRRIRAGRRTLHTHTLTSPSADFAACPREHAHAAGREADGRAYGVVCQWRCVGASSAPGLAAQGAASPPVSLAPTTRPRWPPTRPAHPVCHCPTTRRACPAPPAPAATGAARQRLCASASCAHTMRSRRAAGALAPAGRTLRHRLQMRRGCKPAGGSCGADRGPAGVGSGAQFCTGKTVSSTITPMLAQILAVKLALPSCLPLPRGGPLQGPAGWCTRAAPTLAQGAHLGGHEFTHAHKYHMCGRTMGAVAAHPPRCRLNDLRFPLPPHAPLLLALLV